MTRKVFGLFVGCAVLISVLLSGCGARDEENSPTVTTEPRLTEQQPAKGQTTVANWWDKFGEPQYGSTLVLAMSADPPSWDPIWQPTHQRVITQFMKGYLSRLGARP